MRRILFLAAVVAVFAAPGLASAKLPFFGLEVEPTQTRVGEPIKITMTCFDDMAHTQPSSSCFGAGGSMAWIHPLDTHGDLDRDDWIPVEGHATSSGANRGRLTLDEPGSYDVLPLWRTWGPNAGEGFPDPIRIEVTNGTPPLPIAAAVAGTAAVGALAVVRRRRRHAAPVSP